MLFRRPKKQTSFEKDQRFFAVVYRKRIWTLVICGKCEFLFDMIKPTDRLPFLRTREVYCEIYMSLFSENITNVGINQVV